MLGLGLEGSGLGLGHILEALALTLALHSVVALLISLLFC